MHEVDVSATILRHTRWENSRPTSQQLQYYHKAQQTACSILTFTHTLRCASAALRHTVLHSHTLHCAGAALRHTVPHSHIHCSVLALHCVTRCFTHTHTALCWHCTASHGGTFTHTPRCAGAALRHTVLHSHIHCAVLALHCVTRWYIHTYTALCWRCAVLVLHCVTRCYIHTHTALCWRCTASHGATFTHTPRCADAALRESHGTTFTHTLHGATCLAISSVCGYSLPDTVVSASTLRSFQHQLKTFLFQRSFIY